MKSVGRPNMKDLDLEGSISCGGHPECVEKQDDIATVQSHTNDQDRSPIGQKYKNKNP